MAGERTLPGISLTGYWDAGDNTWKPGMDENLRKLSVLVQLRVLSRTVWPPADDSNSAAVANGDIYIVPAGDSNSMQSSNSDDDFNDIAVFDNGGWVYYTPLEGFHAYVIDEDLDYVFKNGSWVPLATIADFVFYNSTTDSNSTATNVAQALDDLYQRIFNISAGIVDASTVQYGEADSNSVSTDVVTVKDALDEIFERISPLEYFFDIHTFVSGAPTNGELVYRLVAVRAFTIPTSASGAFASAVSASTGDVSFEWRRNGTLFGTVRFNASATGVFDFDVTDSNSDGIGGISFVAGDVLTIIAPASADATLADISFAVPCSRP